MVSAKKKKKAIHQNFPNKSTGINANPLISKEKVTHVHYYVCECMNNIVH
jgi:hypothetical protein